MAASALSRPGFTIAVTHGRPHRYELDPRKFLSPKRRLAAGSRSTAEKLSPPQSVSREEEVMPRQSTVRPEGSHPSTHPKKEMRQWSER
jgi:hypothetical protein